MNPFKQQYSPQIQGLQVTATSNIDPSPLLESIYRTGKIFDHIDYEAISYDSSVYQLIPQKNSWDRVLLKFHPAVECKWHDVYPNETEIMLMITRQKGLTIYHDKDGFHLHSEEPMCLYPDEVITERPTYEHGHVPNSTIEYYYTRNRTLCFIPFASGFPLLQLKGIELY